MSESGPLSDRLCPFVFLTFPEMRDRNELSGTGRGIRFVVKWLRHLFTMAAFCWMGSSLQAGDVLFVAKLSAQDRVNSSGEALKSVAAIIQQDRANYHKWNKRDPEDTSDGGLFSSAKARAELGAELAKVKIPESLRKKILEGSAIVYVGMRDDNSLVIGDTGR